MNQCLPRSTSTNLKPTYSCWLTFFNHHGYLCTVYSLGCFQPDRLMGSSHYNLGFRRQRKHIHPIMWNHSLLIGKGWGPLERSARPTRKLSSAIVRAVWNLTPVWSTQREKFLSGFLFALEEGGGRTALDCGRWELELLLRAAIQIAKAFTQVQILTNSEFTVICNVSVHYQSIISYRSPLPRCHPKDVAVSMGGSKYKVTRRQRAVNVLM